MKTKQELIAEKEQIEKMIQNDSITLNTKSHKLTKDEKEKLKLNISSNEKKLLKIIDQLNK